MKVLFRFRWQLCNFLCKFCRRQTTIFSSAPTKNNGSFTKLSIRYPTSIPCLYNIRSGQVRGFGWSHFQYHFLPRNTSACTFQYLSSRFNFFCACVVCENNVIRVLYHFRSTFLSKKICLLRRKGRIRTCFITNVFILRVNTIHRMNLPSAFRVASSFLSIRTRRKTSCVSISKTCTPRPISTNATGRVRRRYLCAIVLVINSNGSDYATYFPYFFRPHMTRFPYDRFSKSVPFLYFLLHIRISNIRHRPILRTRLTCGILITIKFHSTRVRITVNNFTYMSRTRRRTRRHRKIHPTTRYRGCLIIRQRRLITLSMLCCLLRVRL